MLQRKLHKDLSQDDKLDNVKRYVNLLGRSVLPHPQATLLHYSSPYDSCCRLVASVSRISTPRAQNLKLCSTLWGAMFPHATLLHYLYSCCRLAYQRLIMLPASSSVFFLGLCGNSIQLIEEFLRREMMHKQELDDLRYEKIKDERNYLIQQVRASCTQCIMRFRSAISI